MDAQKERDTPSEGELDLYIDPAEEKKLLRKLDINIAPVIMILFLVSYLDRSNIGNAAIAGMTDELKLVGNQLGNAVTLFYVTYVTFETPCSLVLKKFRPSRFLPTLVVCWGIACVGCGLVKNAGGLYATRLLLGVFESGLFPCLTLWLTTFYKRNEQARRISYLFVSAALAGSFGGLLAYGIVHMDGVGGYRGWRWLFILEGLVSILLGIASHFFLPDTFEEARFLDEHDKELMRIRGKITAEYSGNTDFDVKEVLKAVKDFKTWLSSFCQISTNISLFGFSTFLPAIINGFGNDTVTTQLLTAPVYFWASGIYLLLSYFSDRFNRRAIFMVPTILVSVIGYSILLGVDMKQPGVLYFGTFLVVTGIFVGVGINVTWNAGSHAPYYKRSTAIGIQQSIGNMGGIIAGQIYKNPVNGRYVLGLSVSIGGMILAGLGYTAYWALLRHYNTKRDRMSAEERQAEIDSGKIGDAHPDFRYTL